MKNILLILSLLILLKAHAAAKVAPLTLDLVLLIAKQLGKVALNLEDIPPAPPRS